MRAEIFDTGNYTAGQYDLFFSVMSESRKEKAQRYKSEISRQLCILADYAARKMISEETGLSPESLVFECDSLGKPYAANADVFFSISHSGALAACAINDTPVGADIEKVSEKPLRALRKFACEAEREYIGSDSFRATLIWTLKEAYFKAKGTGIATDLTAVSFKINGEDIICSDSEYTCTSEEIQGGYILSVCCKKKTNQ